MADDQPTPEQWLPVVGYEGHYEVSSHGQVRSLPRSMRRRDGVVMNYRGKILNGGHNHDGGHRTVQLTRGERGERMVQKYVHRLVLEAFVGPCPAGMVTCHRDDNPSNNHLSNLRWDTESANQFDKVRNGNHHMARLTHCKFGHEFTPENIKWTKAGHRHCRECAQRRQRQYEAKLVAKYGPKKFWPKGKKSA